MGTDTPGIPIGGMEAGLDQGDDTLGVAFPGFGHRHAIVGVGELEVQLGDAGDQRQPHGLPVLFARLRLEAGGILQRPEAPEEI